MSNYQVGDIVELKRDIPVWESTWYKGTPCKVEEIVRPGVYYVARRFNNPSHLQVKVADFEIESH